MITKEELRKYANNLGLNLGQAEKNYLHIVTLHAISRLFPDKFVFKGGTSLMICYNLDRFSEDLDFTITNDISMDHLLSRIKKFLEDQRIVVEIKDEENTEISKKVSLRYQGPLYNGTRQTTDKIEMDLSYREPLQYKPEMKRIVHQYDDTPTFYINNMKLEEIFAEKVRALMTREKARDLYDTEYLLSRGIKPDIKLIKKKMSYYKMDFSLKRLEQEVKNKNKLWNAELKDLVPHIPDFNSVKKTVLDSFKNIKYK